MRKSQPYWANWPTTPQRLRALLLLRQRVKRARQSVNDFIEFCLRDSDGRPVRQAEVHRELQKFLDVHPRALIELPRDHGKSVQVCARVLWELGHHPGLRVKIVCATEALAIERCRFLRSTICDNPRCRWVFPQMQPSQPWTDQRFSIIRPGNVIGPSVTALGVDAASTGTRADLLVCDDIVDVRALSSQAERERVKRLFRENLVNLLEPTGRLWNIFTPWHPDDLNGELKRSNVYALFRRAIGPNLEPIWPEKWPRERLAERQREIGSLSFARAYHLSPLPTEETLIQRNWLHLWHEPPAAELVVLSVDPAIGSSPKADASALVTLARVGSEVHCLEAIAHRVSAGDLLTLIDQADQRWQPDVIVFESNAAFEAVRQLLMRTARFGPKVQPWVQTRSKKARILAFAVAVQNGTFRLQGDGQGNVVAGQQALWEEMLSFPRGVHDDLLDAAATGTAYLLGPGNAPRVW